MSGELLLGDRRFDVAEARIWGWLNPPFERVTWGVAIRCHPREFDGEDWEPQPSWDGFPLPVRDWRALAGQSYSGEGDFAPEDVPALSFYLFEHGAIRDSVLRIGARDGADFALSWAGRCDVHYDEAFGEDVPFSAECRARFTGMTIMRQGAMTDAEAAAALGGMLALDGLRQEPVRLVRYPPYGWRAKLLHAIRADWGVATRSFVQFVPE